jgi:hypothetical protein
MMSGESGTAERLRRSTAPNPDMEQAMTELRESYHPYHITPPDPLWIHVPVRLHGEKGASDGLV